MAEASALTEEAHIQILTRRRDYLRTKIEDRTPEERLRMHFDVMELAALDWVLEPLTTTNEKEQEDGSTAVCGA